MNHEERLETLRGLGTELAASLVYQWVRTGVSNLRNFKEMYPLIAKPLAEQIAVPFSELQAGDKFRTIVDAPQILRMKIHCMRCDEGPNCVEIEGTMAGCAQFFADEAMVYPVGE
jgi:hypothetical protein